MLEGNACAKFILFGEHSVVYGGKAIALPVPKLRLNLAIGESESSSSENASQKQMTEAMRLLARKLELDFQRIKSVEISSQIPIGAGLGSSASLCCALVRAFTKLEGKDLAEKTLLGENHFHGKSSGVDPYTVALEKPIRYCAEARSYQELDLTKLIEEDLLFALVDSGKRHFTHEVMNTVKSFKAQDPNAFFRLLEELKGFEEEAFSCLSQSPSSLAKLMNSAHERLKNLGLSTETIEERVRRFSKLGAMGAKITGAGMGGYVLALLKREKLPSFGEEFSKELSFVLDPKELALGTL